MFEKVKTEQWLKEIGEKLDRIDTRLSEVLKVIKEEKKQARNSQNKAK